MLAEKFFTDAMKRDIVKWSIAALLAATAFPAGAETGSAARLQNGELEVTVSLRSGAIESVRRKASGFTHENPANPAEIVSLRVPMDGWDGHSAAGSAAGRVRVSEQFADALVLRFSGFVTDAGKVGAEAEVHYRLDGDNLIVRLSVDNRGRQSIDRIAFPALGVRPAAGGTETLYTAAGPMPLRALFDGNRVRGRHDPFQRLDPSDFRGWFFTDPAIPVKAFAYPAADSSLHTAWLGYEANGEAIGFDVRDQTFQSQFAVVQRDLQRDAADPGANVQNYTLAWHWFPLIEPGGSWESPEIWLKFHAADWHATARQHREWLMGWIRRPDPPEAFRSSLGWISHGITSYDQIPALAQRGVEAGAPYFIVYGWYGYGMTHLSYDYYAREMHGGAESLRRNLAAARALGAHPIAWYNGSTSVETTAGHQQQGKDWLVVDRHGGLTIDGRWSLFDPDRPQVTDDAVTHFNFDLGTPARDFVLDSIRRLIADYGFSGIELDQGGKNFASYRGGPPELRFTRGAQALYEKVMNLVREHDPNGIVVGEGMSDFMNQYVDSSWIFEGGGGIFAGPGDWVEKSTYLRYSLPWVTFPRRAVPEDPGQANEAFLLNAPLDIFADLAEFPDYAHHLKRLHVLKRKVHPMLYGGVFSDQEGFGMRKHDPASVRAKSYVGTDRIAVVVINRSAEPRSAEVEFDGEEAAGRLTGYRLDGTEFPRAGASKLAVDLAPHDVIVLVYERDGSP